MSFICEYTNATLCHYNYILLLDSPEILNTQLKNSLKQKTDFAENLKKPVAYKQQSSQD